MGLIQQYVWVNLIVSGWNFPMKKAISLLIIGIMILLIIVGCKSTYGTQQPYLTNNPQNNPNTIVGYGCAVEGLDNKLIVQIPMRDIL